MLSKFGVHHFIFALLPILLLFQENVQEIPLKINLILFKDTTS